MNQINCFRRFLLGILLAVLILGTGCAAEAEVIPTPTASNLKTPEIAFSTDAPSPTLTPTTSMTPEPSATAQPPRQLSNQEKKAIITNLVRTNNHCTLPCFMGVEFQQATLDDLEKSFSPSMGPGLITRYPSTNEIVFSSTFETENLILGEFKIHFIQGRVDGITSHLGGLWRPEVSMEDWSPYTIKGVFSQLGPPSRILFKFHGPPNEPSESDQGIIVSYYLYYEPIDTIIAYNGQKTDDVPKFHFCPMQQKPEFIGISIGSYTKDITVTGTDLEEASTYTVKDFYNLDWSNPDTCIDLDSAVLKSHP